MRKAIVEPGSPLEVLLNRARRATKKGELRKAMLTLREACYGVRGDARLWVMYAVACYRVRRRSEATDALRQALWLRERAHDSARAEVIRRLMLRFEDATFGDRSAA
ncbi:MAG TPA: hypothetical protein VFQ35_20215 [Polyangiaceae bacterium]|nr:hypothetical protein [Polyangiaceae bacterium]